MVKGELRGLQTANPMQDRSSDFERHRPRLFGAAYRMLSSRADAEDVPQ